MKKKLTRSVIEAAIRKKQRCQIWDSDLKGFYAEIQVTPAGSVSCSYRIRYTHAKKKHVITIGPYDQPSQGVLFAETEKIDLYLTIAIAIT